MLHLPLLQSPACPSFRHPNTCSLVFLMIFFSWKLHLQHLSAYIAITQTSSQTVESLAQQSDLLSECVNFQCPSDELIHNLALPRQTQVNPWRTNFCYTELPFVSLCHRCCLKSTNCNTI